MVLCIEKHPHVANLGGFIPFSSVDWPGHFVAVVFIQGCPWRCHYCHNPHLQSRDHAQEKDQDDVPDPARLHWVDILDFLTSRQGLLDGVIFSGGEPFSEPMCNEMFAQVRALGLKVGVHTAGMYPAKLSLVAAELDWVGLDIKTRPELYDALTGRKNSASPVWRSLEVLLQKQVDFECRTTWSPQWLDETQLIDLAQYLRDQGVRKYAIQRYRSTTDRLFFAELSDPTIHLLGKLFEHFSYR